MGVGSWTLVPGLLIAAFSFSANLHSGEFTIDDSRSIVSNPDVTGGAPIADAFRDDFWGTPIHTELSHKSYRPLTVLSFRASHALHGLNAPAFVATNVALHALAVVSAHNVIRFILGLGKGGAAEPVAVAVATCLFAAHPVHVEAVANATGRAEILAFLAAMEAFMVAARYIALGAQSFSRGKSPPRKVDPYRVHAAVTVLAVAAALFKETGLAVLGVVTVWELLARRFSRGSLVRAVQSTFAVGLFALHRRWLAVSVTPSFSVIDNHIHFAPLWPERIMTALAVHAEYARLLVFPLRLATDYGMGCFTLVSDPLRDPRTVGIVLTYAVLAAWTYLALRSALGPRRDPRIGVALAWVVLPAAPASHIFPIGTVIAERVMYTPSFGICLAVGLAIDAYCKWGSVAGTWERNNGNGNSDDDGDDDGAGLDGKGNDESGSLSESSSSKSKSQKSKSAGSSPSSAPTDRTYRHTPPGRVLVVLSLSLLPLALLAGRCHVRAGDWTDPIRLFESDLVSCPGSCRTMSQVAVTRHIREDLEGAASLYESAITQCNGTESAVMGPGGEVAYDHPHTMLGLLLKRIAERDDSTEAMERATRHFGIATRISRLDATAAKAYGYGLYLQGDVPGALKELRRSVALNTTDPEAHRNLAAVLANEASASAKGKRGGSSDPKRQVYVRSICDIKAHRAEAIAHMSQSLQLSIDQRLQPAQILEAARDVANLLQADKQWVEAAKMWRNIAEWFPSEREAALKSAGDIDDFLEAVRRREEEQARKGAASSTRKAQGG